MSVSTANEVQIGKIIIFSLLLIFLVFTWLNEIDTEFLGIIL